MTPKEILIEAKAKIENFNNWTQGAFARDYPEGRPLSCDEVDKATCWCAYGAVYSSGPHPPERWGAATAEQARATNFLTLAARSLSEIGVAELNDKSKREWDNTISDEENHVLVLKMFDKAIELASA